MAISDATCTLARPLVVLRTTGLDGNALALASAEIERLSTDDEGLGSVVVGLPRRLDGSPNEMTPRVETFATKLHGRTGLPVMLQDERLTSHEAQSRLAVHEKNWRARKLRLDAAAAAVILQDYLDTHPAVRPVVIGDEPEF